MAASWTVRQEQGQEPEVHCFVPQPEEDHGARCAQCRKPFLRSDPWQDYCSHRFCDPCFDDLCNRHSLCPACTREGESYEVGSQNMHFRDPSYLRMKNVKAKCSFNPPCGWVGDFNQLSEHEIWCENRKLCCSNCGRNVLWRQMNDHVTTECRHRRVTCHHCQIEIKYSKIIEHEVNDCPFYHNDLLQRSSNHRDDVMKVLACFKGLWMLQRAVCKKLDPRRHLSNIENSNLVTNGSKVADETSECLQRGDKFQRMKAQIEDLKNNLEVLMRRTDSRDSSSRFTVDKLREEIERFDEECEKLESFKDLANARGEEYCAATVGEFGKLRTSDANKLENSQSEGCGTMVECFGKEDQAEGNGMEAEFGCMEQEKSSSTTGERVERENAKDEWKNPKVSTQVETAEPGKVLIMEREGKDEVNVEKVEMEPSRGSEKGEEMLATEWNGMENNVNNEYGDLATENKAFEPINEEINGHKFKGKVELILKMEQKQKGIGADEEMLEYDPGKQNEEKTEKWNEGNLTYAENQMIAKNDNGSHLCCCQNVPEKESFSTRNNSCCGSTYLSSKPDPSSDQTNFISSNESTEPASHETKRKKKKSQKKNVDQDGGVKNNMIDSKVEQNIFYSSEVYCSKMKACQEKVDVLERAMEVLMREMERQTNTKFNGLLLKLMRDQQSLEGRLNAIEERQNPLPVADA